MKKVKSIMLIDDNSDDNFFHERVIKKCGAAEIVIAKQSAMEALEYLKSTNEQPDIIFLDINMPAMNGWEFLQEYNKLDQVLQCNVIVVMLTTSENPDDKRRSTALNVAEFQTKPLTVKMLEEIILKYF